MLVIFCLMSLMPILAGLYVASRFITFPFNQQELGAVSWVCLFSVLLSFLGFFVARQMMTPITGVSQAAHDIAQGKLDEEPHFTNTDTTDEIQDLTRSLKMISRNAKELLEKVEKLSLKDKLTGLYNSTYIRERLDEEIQRAIHYQRPCSFAYVLIQNYEGLAAKVGENTAEDAMRQVAGIFNDSVREFDRAARVGRGEFVIIFPDKNKKKAIEVMEKIAQRVSDIAFAKEGAERLVPWIGISENPIDGIHADGLYLKAQDRMKMAKQAGKSLEAFA